MAQPLSIAVLHGPNLQCIGQREPAVYGRTTFTELNQQLLRWARVHEVTLTITQSDDESACVAAVHTAAHQGCRAMVMNPGGLTHTSVALRDAIAAVAMPVLEVHISNLAAREPFRSHSLIAPVAAGTIFGFGVIGYEIALEAALRLCKKTDGA